MVGAVEMLMKANEQVLNYSTLYSIHMQFIALLIVVYLNVEDGLDILTRIEIQQYK